MLKIAISFLFVFLAAPVWCQPPQGFGRGGMMRSPAFQALDADKDGILTADEIRKSAQATATSATRGRGEGGEGRPGPEGGRGEGPTFMRLDPILAALDINSDGEVSAGEIAAAATSLKKLDKNGD